MYVHTHITYMLAYIDVYVSMHVHTYKYITYMHTYKDLYVSMHVCTYILVYRHAYGFVNTYMHAYMDKYTHVYACIIYKAGLSRQHSNGTVNKVYRPMLAG